MCWARDYLVLPVQRIRLDEFTTDVSFSFCPWTSSVAIAHLQTRHVQGVEVCDATEETNSRNDLIKYQTLCSRI